MTLENYEIRPLEAHEIGLAIQWAFREGWNPGLNDAACYYRADPEGFLVGMLKDQPIATISAIRYGEAFGFLGLYIVEPEYRGQSYGYTLWEAALERLSGRCIGLDGVPAQQTNYQKSGFQLAYRNIRFRTHGTDSRFQDPAIIPLSQISLEELLRYDEPFFPEPRPVFLKAWMSQPDSAALAYQSDGRLLGLGVIRMCFSGYKIGPLYADAPEIADLLFQALIDIAEAGEPVSLDVPEVNVAAMKLAEQHQMVQEFETARMYSGRIPEIDLDRLYGVTSFEIG